MSAAPKESPPAGPQPLIPEKYLDVPSQRLYYLSFGFLCQSIKILDFARSLFSVEESFNNCKKWMFVDFAYVAILSQLRIPRLKYGKAVVLLQIAMLWFLDGLMFGGISLNMARGASGGAYRGPSNLPSTPQPYTFIDFLAPISLGLLTSSSHGKDAHLLGQHTVRMSPISTARINPNGLTFCLASPSSILYIPVLLNNTIPSALKYSLTPLGYTEESKHGKVEQVELSHKDLNSIEQSRTEGLQLTRPSLATPVKSETDDYDEYDDDDDANADASQSNLQKTQSMVHIRLSKPGTLRLERVVDASSNIDARLAYPNEVTVVPCPSVGFVQDPLATPSDDVRCLGQEKDVELMIDIHGVPPLSLRWFKAVNGKKEHFLVEGIEGNHHDAHRHHQPGNNDDSALSSENGQVAMVRKKGVPQSFQVPLSVSLDALGTHLYALEEVMDAAGNLIRVGPDTTESLDGTNPNTKTTRSFMVLRRPTMSFKHCGPGHPTSLLIGSEAPLTISAVDVDAFDAPWDVLVRYQPPSPSEDGVKSNKRYKAWRRTLQTHNIRRDLTLRANAPGEYTIVGVRGKWCEGDVLAPETCKVIERPMPTAEIEWKRIHECSGDTGVSASLVLHGTPPFSVYYRTQRDKEPPRELVKTFTNSRGELTLQPERSGHYIYTFVQLSDANYKHIELKGPSIDQVVHPLAAADFAEAERSKRRISSCEGSMVEVGVDLRGTGPWTLDVQIVGPKSSEIIQIQNITTPRKKLQIPIPKVVDRDGGTFDIDLISIEDAYGCKRPITVPGLSVNVRRVKPTVRFYGKEGKRNVTVLERERADLPLRLTGDGPWRIKYRRSDGADHELLSATLHSPNDQLHVTKKGLYEIADIADSQCPGHIIADGSTYQVSWVPRPYATLSSQTEATYETYNGSYVLPPICEGMDDHVDLDLVGRPPFQIMYNVATGTDTGGTKLLDQPTFNSIQPRTRFQLHTSNPGRMYYEVKQIGDAAYPLAKHKDAVIPRSERLLFEQQVSMRPSARFKNRNRMSYCYNDAFTPRDPLTMDGMVVLEGTPPFRLQLSIKNLAASQVETKTVEVRDNVWKIDLPSYNFKSMGPHLITVESVQDASNCAQAVLDPLTNTIWVDVAETAAIIPFDRREDFCVGDVSQFQLEGTPPWTIGYRINGKSLTEESKVSPFSLLQQQPGEFTITSIAHQQKMCKTAVTDLRFMVHPLPSAQVGHGKRIYQDIHEGDQAEIVFTLIGEPPFTFTYQRAEAVPKKGGKPGKVLETHTVSRVTTTEYSIYSALEGTWTVTSISDKYCRYPQAQPDTYDN